MTFDDVLISVADDGRVELATKSMPFFRGADGSWVADDFPSPADSFNDFSVVDDLSEAKALINDLLTSSCVIPSLLRADLQALL